MSLYRLDVIKGSGKETFVLIDPSTITALYPDETETGGNGSGEIMCSKMKAGTRLTAPGVSVFVPATPQEVAARLGIEVIG